MDRVRHVHIAIWLMIGCVVGGLLLVPYSLELAPNNNSALTQSQYTIAVTIGSVLQNGFLGFFGAWAGLALASRVGLEAPFLRKWVYGVGNPVVSRKWIWIATAGVAAITVAFLLLNLWLQPHLPTIDVPHQTWWKGVLTMFSGGIFEETMLRLFTMTLLVWVIAKAARIRAGRPIPSAIYWVANILAAVLFGAGHLSNAAVVYGSFTPFVVIATIVPNAMYGIWFGYLYKRKGLEYAIGAHMITDVLLHGILGPLTS